MPTFVNSTEAERLLLLLPDNKEYAIWDKEIEQIYGPNHIARFVSDLAYELEVGGLEEYFLKSSGAGAPLCVQALEVTGDILHNPLPQLLWQGMEIIGSDTVWRDPAARKRSIEMLTNNDREMLHQLGDMLLNYLYDYDIVLDC